MSPKNPDTQVEDIVWEALAVALGKPPSPKIPTFNGNSMLGKAYFNGLGSQNIPKAAEAYRLIKDLPGAESNAMEIIEAERNAFMTTEFMSFLYEESHVIPFAVFAQYSLVVSTRRAAQEWLATWLRLVEEMYFPPNGLATGPGMRSGGHFGMPAGKREWLRAKLLRNQGAVKQAEVLCRRSGIGLKNRWWYTAGNAALNAFDGSSRPTFNKFLRPLYVARGKDSVTSWIEPGDNEYSNVNSNTPPVLAVKQDLDGISMLPSFGGNHFRQKFEHSKARRVGQEIVYDSDLNKSGSLTLPSDVVITEYGRG